MSFACMRYLCESFAESIFFFFWQSDEYAQQEGLIDSVRNST